MLNLIAAVVIQGQNGNTVQVLNIPGMTAMIGAVGYNQGGWVAKGCLSRPRRGPKR